MTSSINDPANERRVVDGSSIGGKKFGESRHESNWVTLTFDEPIPLSTIAIYVSLGSVAEGYEVIATYGLSPDRFDTVTNNRITTVD